MPKVSQEFSTSRREEIISACEKLYQTMNFKDITIIEIGKITSFTRTSIYNYFNTKEEIFLALHQKEYELWIDELEKIISDNETLTREEFADLLAKSLENRLQLLKLMSMNHFDMEMNSRQENLIEFKKVYGQSLATVKKFPQGRTRRRNSQARKFFGGNNFFGEKNFDAKTFEKKIIELLDDDDVTNNRGIYEYLLSGEEKHLNIRKFTPKMKRVAYERQSGICKICGKKFEIGEMHGDHIVAWSNGGKTVAENCQMLCAKCNREKSNL